MEFTEEQQSYIDELLQNKKTEWENEVVKPLQDKIEELTPKEKSEEEKAIELKTAELKQKEISLILKENGLEEFGEFLHIEDVEDLQEKIEKLKNVLETRNTFKPEDHRQADTYSKMENNKDAQGMISFKLSKLF